jgi:hypothetical protein
MEQETIEKLIAKYYSYDNGKEFILASIELFSNLDSRSLKNFIEQTFTNNNIESCYGSDFIKLGKHWNNIAKTKLELNDYSSYLRSMSTSARFYAIGKFLINEGY